MKIIIDNGTYELRNMGDIAMLQITVARLCKLFPDASLRVFTAEPDRLLSFCPGTEPLNMRGRDLYFQCWNILGGTSRLVPNKLHEYFLEMEHWLRLQSPEVMVPWIKHRLERHVPNLDPIDEYREEIADSDLVVASGGGYINDSFPIHAEMVLKTLQFAQRLGKPTVLMGQGLGPLTNSQLRRLASEVLGNVNLIGLREGQVGPHILSELGVPDDRIVVTGDDAVELAYESRTESLGSDLGINLRLASYSQVTDEQVKTVRSVLHKFVDKVSSKLKPIPISYHPGESDLKSIEVLLNKQEEDFEIEGKDDLGTPKTVIQAAGTCRVVVTGSYHAAVFALSQGISVVGLSKSQYYKTKFSGLEEQFGEGVEHVGMDGPSFEIELMAAIEKAWSLAELVRPKLLRAAQRQIELGLDFYAQMAHLVCTLESR